MTAIREIVSRNIFVNFEVPEEFGDTFEMILVPIDVKVVNDIGFSSEEVVDQGEDVWNEKIENERFLAANYNATIKEDTKEDEIWSKYL